MGAKGEQCIKNGSTHKQYNWDDQFLQDTKIWKQLTQLKSPKMVRYLL